MANHLPRSQSRRLTSAGSPARIGPITTPSTCKRITVPCSARLVLKKLEQSSSRKDKRPFDWFPNQLSEWLRCRFSTLIPICEIAVSALNSSDGCRDEKSAQRFEQIRVCFNRCSI